MNLRFSKHKACWLLMFCVTTRLLTAELLAGDDALRGVQPFFTQHCLRCHGPDREEGGMRVDQLTSDLDDFASIDHYQNILDQLATEAMPPEGEPRPSARSVTAISRTLTKQIEAAQKKHNSGGGKPIRRLTRTEFLNTIQDLMGVRIADIKLPADGVIGGFETDANSLYTTDMHFELYLSVAREAVSKFIASRAEPPGRKEVPVNFSKRLTRADFLLHADNLPAAGHLVVRTGWWKSDPQDRRPVFVGVSQEGPDSKLAPGDGILYELTGTRDNPLWIEKTYDVPTQTVKWRISGVKVKSQFRDKGLERRVIRKLNRFKLSNQTLVEGQRLLLQKPATLGAIHNFHVINPQPYDFFSPILKSYPGREQLPNSAAPRILREFTRLVGRGREMDRRFIKSLNKIFLQGRQQGEPFWEAIAEPMAVGMCSIECLFHMENKQPGSTVQEINGIEFANRLSYMLWRSAPDSQLLALARAGSLLDPVVKSEQIARMMRDEKFDRFLDDFTQQWLELEKQDLIAVDSRVYGKFSDSLKKALKQETIQFVSYVIRQDLPAKNFIDSDFVMLNDATASHYGVPGDFGKEFVATPRPNQKRGGLLTQAGILMQTGTGDRTSIVERGAFISRKILGVDPPPPPPNVEPLPTDNENLAFLPAAEIVKLHLSKRQCTACHSKIDPLGMGLEEFDAIGLYRTVETRLRPGVDALPRKKRRRAKDMVMQVDLATSGRVPGGRRFEGVETLKRALLLKKRQVAKSYTEALLAYANGRAVGAADEAIVEEILTRTARKDYPTATILREVLTSKAMTSFTSN